MVRVLSPRSLPLLLFLLFPGLAAMTGNLLAPPGEALANGSTRPLVKSERAGPYTLEVGIFPGTPRVGNLHLSIQVLETDTGQAITDALIMASATGPPEATDVGSVKAVNAPQSPRLYDLDIPLDMEGAWSLAVQVEAARGPARLEIPLNVTRGGGFSLAFLAALSIAAMAVAVLAWSRITRHRRRRRRA